MGDLKIHDKLTSERRKVFSEHLLADIEALKTLLEKGKIEQGITRIGAEQEFCLVDKTWRPSSQASEVLKAINDSHFTSELALFNLEINLDPLLFTGDAFTKMESQLKELLRLASQKAKGFQEKVILAGILPNITKLELGLEYITPEPRFLALNERLKALRGGDFSLYLAGVDELSINHDSVLFEACNTSFQMHLQIDPTDFSKKYNWAQLISAPVLAVSTNSPLLLGRELWSETRIGLFQQSIDTRSSSYALKEQPPRVSFGSQWASGTLVDYFKNEIAQFKLVLTKDIEKNSLEELQKGNIPKLQALNLFNGTIYRWNRPCFGVHDGVAHVRIENRYIPAGPSVTDEIANFAFWTGLMCGMPEEYENVSQKMSFKEVKSNFINAARIGKKARMNWMGKELSMKSLVLTELLPIAKKGLQLHGIEESDINRLLGIIEGRLLGASGSEWTIDNFRKLSNGMKSNKALLGLTQALYERQESGFPVHEWDNIQNEETVTPKETFVLHAMSTLVFTVHEEDLAEMALKIMDWKNIHHVPVEDSKGNLKGLLTWSHLQRFQKENQEEETALLVHQIMINQLWTIKPKSSLEEAKVLMLEKNIGCLPVVDHGQLVGILTRKDVDFL